MPFAFQEAPLFNPYMDRMLSGFVVAITRVNSVLFYRSCIDSVAIYFDILICWGYVYFSFVSVFLFLGKKSSVVSYSSLL